MKEEIKYQFCYGKYNSNVLGRRYYTEGDLKEWSGDENENMFLEMALSDVRLDFAKKVPNGFIDVWVYKLGNGKYKKKVFDIIVYISDGTVKTWE